MTYNAEEYAVARTLYGEAEANDTADAVAIAHVIRNRMAYPNWPAKASMVVMQPYQFSCWNADNPRRPILAALEPGSSAWAKECFEIARDVLTNLESDDPTNGSTHYHTTYIKKPRWAKGKLPVYETPAGKFNHLFYNNIDTDAPAPRTAKQALDQQRPLSQSGTVKGGGAAVAGGAIVGGLRLVQEIVDGASGLAATLDSLSGPAFWIGVSVVIAGGAYAVYRRVQDRAAGKN